MIQKTRYESRDHEWAQLSRGLLAVFLALWTLDAAALPTAALEDSPRAAARPSPPTPFARRPPLAPLSPGPLTRFPKRAEHETISLIARDLSSFDLSDKLDDLLFAEFDTRTTWPDASLLPKGFDPAVVLEMGRNPGLRVRELHQQSITGRGVSIAIIDLPLSVEHPEYAERLKLYEEVGIPPHAAAHMHGPAVASIAVGNTLGVAPGADLYFIAAWEGDPHDRKRLLEIDVTCFAKAVRRILQINRDLPHAGKIRVISMSFSWRRSQKGFHEMQAAVNEAREAGMFILSTDNFRTMYGFSFQGLDRSVNADPDDFNTYRPGIFWASRFYRPGLLDLLQGSPGRGGNVLLLPMDSRTTAGPWERDNYVFYRQGGLSWTVPYLAGVYALAAQVEPSITPQRFWSLALKTGRRIQIPHGETTVSMGPIIDPVAIMNALRDR